MALIDHHVEFTREDENITCYNAYIACIGVVHLTVALTYEEAIMLEKDHEAMEEWLCSHDEFNRARELWLLEEEKVIKNQPYDEERRKRLYIEMNDARDKLANYVRKIILNGPSRK